LTTATPEEARTQIVNMVREFVRRDVEPVAAELDREDRVPHDLIDKMKDLGLFGITVPEKYGGLGLDYTTFATIFEELSKGFMSITGAIGTQHILTYVLMHYGTEEQKQRFLPGLASGRKRGGLALTEPGGGSDVANLKTTATKDGEEYVINGTKMFITNGSIADVVFVAAKTNLEVKGSRGVSIFAVEQGTEGFSASRALEKMGWHASDTAELVLDDVWVPAENLIGEENRGFYYIMSNFQNERLAMMGLALGESQKALEMTIEYVKNRSAFGAPLWNKQAIRHRLAMRQAQVDAAREFTYRAAWLTEQGEDAVRETSEVKALVGELSNRVLYDCVQFHGGMGYIAESAVERMYRDVRLNSIGGGATEVMLDEVAKRL